MSASLSIRNTIRDRIRFIENIIMNICGIIYYDSDGKTDSDMFYSNINNSAKVCNVF